MGRSIRLGSCLRSMNRAFGDLRRDPEKPSELEAIVRGLHDELVLLHDETEDVGFGYLNGKLYLEGSPAFVETVENQLLVERLESCRVRYLAFLKGTAADDLLAFFKVADAEANRPSSSPLARVLSSEGIQGVRVVEAHAGPSEGPEPARERARVDWYERAVAAVDRVQVQLLGEQKADIEALNRLADDLIAAMRMKGRGPFLLLPLLGRGMDPHMAHSVNTAILCCALGEMHGLGFDRIRTLCAAAFLHDMGRCIIPVEWAKEQARLTMFERVVVHQHSTWGFLLLARDRGIPPEMSVLAAHHHSNPMRSPQGQVYEPDVFHMILHVADAYDLAVFDDKRYWRKHRQDRMLKSILRGRERRYDPTAAKLLANCVGYHPVGSLVRLGDGRRGLVVRPGLYNPERPKVWLFEESPAKIVDLMDIDESGLRFRHAIRDVLAPEPGLDLRKLLIENAELLLGDSL